MYNVLTINPPLKDPSATNGNKLQLEHIDHIKIDDVKNFASFLLRHCRRHAPVRRYLGGRNALSKETDWRKSRVKSYFDTCSVFYLHILYGREMRSVMFDKFNSSLALVARLAR